MGGKLDEQTIEDSKRKLQSLQRKLEEIEVMKSKEPGIRREIAALRSKLGDAADEPLADDDDAVSPAEEAMDPQKRLKNLNKKLSQIGVLKQKLAAGGQLDSEASAKVASEARVLREIQALKAGEQFDHEKDALEAALKEPAKAALPTDAGEVEKRLKALRKKLAQIDELKKKDKEQLDKDARSKIDGERRLRQEVAALESGAAEVVFAPPDEDELIEQASQAKIEVDKKIKALRKKLSQIEGLKAKGGGLDANETAKVESEATLKKELGALEREMGALNRAERERVAKRLGH